MRGAGIALIAALGGMLLSPASPLADEPPVPPQAVVETPATTVQAGKAIQLDSSKSTPGSAAIVDHLWDLDGNGSFETDTGAVPTAQLTPRDAGPLTVLLRVVDAQGQTSDAKLDLNVTQQQTTGTIEDVVTGSSAGQGQGQVAVSRTIRATTAPALVPPKRLHAHRAKAHRKPAAVHAAASAGVVIKNFAFNPGTSTVHVGDTITWTNQDVAPHTATAKDGSWDTGTIKKGKTGSHTFTTAGSIPYYCSIHPNMKGTVVVLAASSSGGTNPSSGSGSGSGSNSGGTSSGSNSSASPSSSSSSSSSLPHTGFDIAVLVFIAMCLTGSGASLRRALR